ncbi:MAG: J domain-containing protein [Acidobacteria bacterium]|nr:J domain-containing protein [Acidobacteriota bacterium]
MERKGGSERRDSDRRRIPGRQRVTLWLEEKTGGWSQREVEVADRSARGVGLVLGAEAEPGQAVILEGDGFIGGSGERQKGRICWCRATVDGRFRAGVRLAAVAAASDSPGEDFVDFYEVMELSVNATTETIHRIYRILAQRLHPDNGETGSAEAFRRLSEAYRTLSDPEKHAAFGGLRIAKQKVQWRVFDQKSATPGVEQEQSKRQGVLKALYLKRLREPESPGMNMVEMEALLGTPREHLDFTMWFLKEQGWATRTDNGRYSITVKGVEQAELMKFQDQPKIGRLQLEPAN